MKQEQHAAAEPPEVKQEQHAAAPPEVKQEQHAAARNSPLEVAPLNTTQAERGWPGAAAWGAAAAAFGAAAAAWDTAAAAFGAAGESSFGVGTEHSQRANETGAAHARPPCSMSNTILSAETWECQRCTFMNNGHAAMYLQCAACSSERDSVLDDLYD